MKIKKVCDFEYEVIDPVTEGTWRVVSAGHLSDIGVQYTIMDIILREGTRPNKGSTITAHFSFQVEGDDYQKSEAQKLLELLLNQDEL